MSFKVPKISRHGYGAIACMVLATIILGFASKTLCVMGVFMCAFFLLFFRDPERIPLPQAGLAVSPADGVVSSIVELAELPENLRRSGVPPNPVTRVSIFLSVFDVHVNRNPIDGLVKDLIYAPGKFINATLDKESQDNENNSIILEDSSGDIVAVSQIAGLIARRIICELQIGDRTAVGARFGIIKFGSRVNLYLPSSYKIMVTLGQRMVGGETIIGIKKDAQPAHSHGAKNINPMDPYTAL